MIQVDPDKIAFDAVCRDLRMGLPLTLKHVTDVFGWPFVELLIISISGERNTQEVFNLLSDIRYELQLKRGKPDA